MSEFYQLFDATTGNLVTEFDSEEEAIEALNGIWADEGDEPISEYTLFRFRDGKPSVVAREQDLVLYLERARERGHRPASAAGRAVLVQGIDFTTDENGGRRLLKGIRYDDLRRIQPGGSATLVAGTAVIRGADCFRTCQQHCGPL